MPRSAFFSRATIANAALDIVREQGFDALTARSLSKQLGCSLSPIFTVFSDMDEIKTAVRETAYALFSSHVRDVMDYNPPFKEYGMRLIRFAKEEQNIFHLLFLDRSASTADIPDKAKECLQDVQEAYQLTDAQAALLFRQLWPFTCGIALLATQAPDAYPEELISEMVTTQFTSTMAFLKSGRKLENITPHLRTEGEKTTLDL